MAQVHQSEVTEVDSFQPNYQRKCENCGQTPTVTAVKSGQLVHDVGLCGPCTWGEAACIDPKNWN